MYKRQTVLCSSVALVCARCDYAVISVGTLSTSIAYWRKPRRGSVERQFDRLWVLLSFLYQGRSACRELGAGRLAAYWALALVTLCCYARARRLGGKGELDASARWHSGIHLVGNVANAILYADPDLRRNFYLGYANTLAVSGTVTLKVCLLYTSPSPRD